MPQPTRKKPAEPRSAEPSGPRSGARAAVFGRNRDPLAEGLFGTRGRDRYQRAGTPSGHRQEHGPPAAVTLVAEGLLEQDRESGKYQLGIALFRLGALVRRRMNVSNEARPYLYDLREKINETVHLAILDGSEIMYVYNLESTQAIRMRSDIGVRKPAYCTAEGQAILAFQPNDVVDRVIEAGLEPRTPKTITSAEKFIKALGATRQRGCAIEDEESEIGMVCIAAPIRDDSGDVVAAVGIAGPLTRLSKKSIAAVMPHVIATADLVSARLGYRGRTQA